MIIYIKFLILSLIVLICTYIGYLKSLKYKNRLEDMKVFRNLFHILKSKIEFTSQPIKEILNEYNGNQNMNFFVNKIIDNLEEENLLNAWKTALKESNFNLKREDEQIIVELAQVLGTTGKNDQIAQIDLTLTFLEKQIEEANFEKNKNEGLYRKLGLISGLVVAILLV